MASIRLISPYPKDECQRRLIASSEGRLPFRWITWAGAAHTRRLVGRFDGPQFHATIAGPATPRILGRLPNWLRAVPVFQSGLQVLSARLVAVRNGAATGTMISGEIRQPIVDYFIVIGGPLLVLAAIRGDALLALMAVPAAALFRFTISILYRERLGADEHELSGRIQVTLDARPVARVKGAIRNRPRG